MTWWETALSAAAAASAAVPMALRWLRVAQREHYLTGAVSRFQGRWWRSTPTNAALGVVFVGLVVGSLLEPGLGIWWVLAGAAIVVVFPIGLPVVGSTSPLRWTPRMRRVAWGSGALVVAVATGVGVVAGAAAGLLVGLGAGGPLIDLALWALAPVERREQARWVDQARAGLRAVGPAVVAITGSYGKTTTKEYARRILATAGPTLASPASFNNAMGLARTVNEHLALGTSWFVAEMGTYGPGEIRSMCEWVSPDIAAITAIGPMHLERFGTLDVTLAAKAEISERARVVVLNVDDPRLAGLAARLEEQGREVVRVGTMGDGLDVAVVAASDGWAVAVRGGPTTTFPPVPFPTNLAVAVGIGLAARVPMEGLAVAFEGVASPDHRQTVARGPGGFWVVDDTFNSNPVGAAVALETLAATGGGRKVVVTPGMVELGRSQREENRRFGLAAANVADDLVIVRRTNRAALRAGAIHGRANVRFAASREEAVAWVRATLSGNDAVLYENDLPDHYP